MATSKGLSNVFKLRDIVNVKDPTFGAKGDGTTDDTTAINAGIARAVSSGNALYLPSGTYLVTSSLTTIAGQFSMFGDGPYKSRIKFAPTAADTLIELSNGASRVERVVLRDFAMYSEDATYTKIALDVYDLSVCIFERLFIYGTGGSGAGAGATWSGNGNTSIGVRTHGRETVSLKDIEIVADKPIVVSANPNTAATAGEDMDHWHWQDCYLIGNGNYIIKVDDGLGMENVTFDGYQAWVGGTGGFYMNDTRGAPTVYSHSIKFKGVRTEQSTDTAGYAFNISSAFRIGSLDFEDCFLNSAMQGIKIDRVLRLGLHRVTTARGSGDSLKVTTPDSDSVIDMEGCVWQPGSTFTLTSYTPTMIRAFNATNFAGPATATYVNATTGSLINTGAVTSVVTATLTAFNASAAGGGDRLKINPSAAGNGAQVIVANDGNTDYKPATLTAEYWDFKVRTGTNTSARQMLMDSTGAKMGAYRLSQSQGAVLTAANNLTLGSDGNYFQVDGATQINLILNTNWQGGSVVTLKFNSTPTVKHNQAASGNNKPILLAGAVDFVASANDTLTLRYDSTDSVWYEMSRAVI